MAQETSGSIFVQVHACWASVLWAHTIITSNLISQQHSSPQKFPFRRNLLSLQTQFPCSSTHSARINHTTALLSCTPSYPLLLCFFLHLPYLQPDPVVSSYLSLGICFSLIFQFYHSSSSFRGQKSR